MSKIKELKEKNPNFVIDIIKDLSDRDPSGTNKYLPFMVKACQKWVAEYFNTGTYMDETFDTLIHLIQSFEMYSSMNLIENKDIYSYDSVDDIEAVVAKAKKTDSTRLTKQMETLVLYEDATRKLVKPLTQKSSDLYGKNTKWCTTSTISRNNFDTYGGDGVLIYFIYKDPPKNLPEEWRKIAFNRQNLKEDRTVWNALDKQISPFDALRLFNFIGQEMMEIVATECDLCIPNMALKKNENGSLMVNASLWDRDYYKKNRAKIEQYLLDLNKGKLETFDDRIEDEPEAADKKKKSISDEISMDAPSIMKESSDAMKAAIWEEIEKMKERDISEQKWVGESDGMATLDAVGSLSKALSEAVPKANFSQLEETYKSLMAEKDELSKALTEFKVQPRVRNSEDECCEESKCYEEQPCEAPSNPPAGMSMGESRA